jgi:DNA invertase Pin-like site-specific DNA recombinase
MLRIGYVRLRDAASAEDTATLKAAGCHVVRAEEPAANCDDDTAVLDSILDFIGHGDQLVIARLNTLGRSARAMLDVFQRLEQRGAVLEVLEDAMGNQGAEGRAIVSVLQALAPCEPALGRRRAPASEIRELQRAGVGPVEIARRLGVSRMTVWRKLKADA